VTFSSKFLPSLHIHFGLKNAPLFTDFYNMWHTMYSVNLLHNTYIVYPPRLCTAATLPQETSSVHIDYLSVVSTKSYTLQLNSLQQHPVYLHN